MAEERVIVLRGKPIIDEQNAASATITPGMAIEISSNEWEPHTGALDNTRAFALERDELGDGIDVDYASGDIVKAGYFAKGDRVNALVPSGEVIAEGAQVEVDAGNPGFVVGGVGIPIGVAAEDIDTTAGQGRGAVIIN